MILLLIIGITNIMADVSIKDIDVKTAIREQFDPNLERAVIEVAKKYALKQGKVETYEVFVNHYVRELMSELGIK